MSDKVEFLSDILSRRWLPDGKSALQSVGLFIGQGTNGLEVAVAQASQAPARSVLVEIWKARKGRRAAPLLLIVLHADRASLTGATGEVPPVYEDMDAGQVERLCREALGQPDRQAGTGRGKHRRCGPDRRRSAWRAGLHRSTRRDREIDEGRYLALRAGRNRWRGTDR